MPGARLSAVASVASLFAVLLSATSFQRSDYAAGQSPVAIVSGDFNADGKPDLAMANAGGATSISVLPGIGGGKFGPALFSDTGIFPSSLAVGDFNHDGRLDLLVHGGFGGKVAVMLGNGDGTFQARRDSALKNPGVMALAEFNLDSKIDSAVGVFITCPHGECDFVQQVDVYLNNGDGTFRWKSSTSMGSDDINL